MRNRRLFSNPLFVPLLAWLAIAVLVGLAIQQTACAHRRPGPQGQPPQPATPYEQAMAANTVLAITNAQVAKGVIAVQEAGLITVADAQPILDAQFDIAVADRELTQILELGPEAATGQASKINELIARIAKAADNLILTGAIQIKNPESQAQLSGNVAAVAQLARSLTGFLKLAGVLK